MDNNIKLDGKADLVYVNNELLLKKDLDSYNVERDILTNTFNSYQSIQSNTIRLATHEQIVSNNMKLALKADESDVNVTVTSLLTKFDNYDTSTFIDERLELIYIYEKGS
mgnify:CR=1 FL=1